MGRAHRGIRRNHMLLRRGAMSLGLRSIARISPRIALLERWRARRCRRLIACHFLVVRAIARGRGLT